MPVENVTKQRKFMQNAHLLRFVQMPIRFGLVKVKKWGMGMDMDTLKVFTSFEHLKLPLPIPSSCTSSQIYFSNHVSLQYSRLCVLTLCVLCLAENSYPFRARLKFLYFSVNVTFGYFMRFFMPKIFYVFYTIMRKFFFSGKCQN